MKKQRFTLIELLTCVAVIAILVALLMPVLGRARKKAINVLCISNQRQIGIGLIGGAADNNGKWIDRTDLRRGNGRPYNFRDGGRFDHIDRFKDYIDAEVMGCPFTGSDPKWEPEPSGECYMNYNIFAGYKYMRYPDYMERPQDTLKYNGDEYGVIAGDVYMYRNDTQVFSHPDDWDWLFRSERDGGPIVEGATFRNSYHCRYFVNNLPLASTPPPPATMNFCFRDGSVVSYDSVQPGSSSDIGYVPDKWENTGSFGAYRGRMLLPKLQ